MRLFMTLALPEGETARAFAACYGYEEAAARVDARRLAESGTTAIVMMSEDAATTWQEFDRYTAEVPA